MPSCDSHQYNFTEWCRVLIRSWARSVNTSKLNISACRDGEQEGKWPSTHGALFSNSYLDEIASPPLDVKCRGYCIIHKGRELKIFPSKTTNQ